MKKISKRAIALTMAAAIGAPAFQISGAGTIEAKAVNSIDRVMVHDPSIFQYQGDYYVFGSHIATAKSNDLVNWTQVSTDYQNPSDNVIYGNLKENLAESFKWAGYDDGDCAGGNYAVWAPDVIYNPNYVWKDGHKGAYMLYYSASSTWRRSCIGYMVSDRVDGDYEYGGTVVYSGFTNTGKVNYDGNSKRDTTYTNDYLPFNNLISNGVIDGDVSTWKCFNKDGSWNNNYAPNAIDPTLFYDGTGQHLYMVYGSWSGGLFILEIDQKTGEAIYPGKDGVEPTSGNTVDRYFGVHIAGGNHQSGEGPYIEYDKNTGYYYMYETYGGLTTTGGYNMRLFRSKNVYGPYEDASGKNAAGSGVNCYQYGTKLIGNYQFYNQPGYRAAGHNSALITDDGKYYLVYHQRFLDASRGEGHEVRVHQQFLNEDDWLVTAVYENRNELIQKYTMQDVVGSYEFINHGNAEKDGSMLATQTVLLNSDGTISGDETGTWSMKDGKDYTYVTLDMDGATYKGVFFEQTNDNGVKTMTFSAIGNNNLAVWGSKFEQSDDLVAGKVVEQLKELIPSTTRENISLPKELSGATIEWSSDNEAVISTKGVVGTPNEDTTVTLTATITSGDVVKEASYEVIVYDNPKVIVGYDFNSYDGKSIFATSLSQKNDNATLKGAASVVEDEVRGNVLKIENTEGSKQVNYLSLPNDVFANVDKAGYTVSLWVNVDSSTWEHSALFEADWLTEGSTVGTYPMTRIGANLIGRINANEYSDAFPGIDYSKLTNKWQLVTYTVAPDGIKVYLDGNQVVYDKKDISNCFSGRDAAIQNTNHVMVGAGDIWNDEDVRAAMFDDVRIYDTALTSNEVEKLYDATYKEKKNEEEIEEPQKTIDEEEPEVEGQTKVYVRLDREEFKDKAILLGTDEEGQDIFGESGKVMAHIGNGWYSVNVPDNILLSDDMDTADEVDVDKDDKEAEEKLEEENVEALENLEDDANSSNKENNDEEKQTEEKQPEETKTDNKEKSNDADIDEENEVDSEISENVEEEPGIIEELVNAIKSVFTPMVVKAEEHNIFKEGVALSISNGNGLVKNNVNALFTTIRPSESQLIEEESKTEEPKAETPSSSSDSAGVNPGSSGSSTGSTVTTDQPATTTIDDSKVPTTGDTKKLASNDAGNSSKAKSTTTKTIIDESKDETSEKVENNLESKDEVQEKEATVDEKQDTTSIKEDAVPQAVEDISTEKSLPIIPIVAVVIILVAVGAGVFVFRKKES